MLADLPLLLSDGIEDSRNTVSDILAEDKLAKTKGEQDANGRIHEIQQVGIRKMDAEHKVADAMGRLLDNDGRQSRQKTRWDAE